jgi:hypothetical protein
LKANIEAAMLEYTNNLDKWNIQICSLCKTSNVYNKKPFDASNYHCAKCSAKKKRNYLSSQDADPGSIPAHLPRLTFMEEQLIALVSINQHVYFRSFKRPLNLFRSRPKPNSKHFASFVK